jgi:hypothetical protein
MDTDSRQRGMLLLLAVLLLMVLAVGALGLHGGVLAAARQRERESERALAIAREALIAYASDHPINSSVGPGYLPCPDLDNDGWAEPTCGSLSGDSGQEQRLGRLPWKTLGLPDLRDGHGERLWYAVSSKYKGLLNCAASRGCVDMSPPAALGTISVRDASGFLVYDGTVGDASRARQGGAVAVVIAPGPPLEREASGGRRTRLQQHRECPAGDCEPGGRCTTEPPQRAARCDPVNYLDAAPALPQGGEDNADFVDRNDASGRRLNRNGFVQGPVMADGRIVVNDRLAVVTYADVVPRVMRRVALELAACLRFYASRPGNAGRYPWMGAACADPAHPVRDQRGSLEGRVPDTPFAATTGQAATMLPRWWRSAPRSPEDLSDLPTHDDACRIAIEPDDTGPARAWRPPVPEDEGSTAGSSTPSWWNTWKGHVTVALAPSSAPQAPADAACTGNACLAIADRDGTAIATGKSLAVVVRASAASCTQAVTACDASGCRVLVDRAGGEAVAWVP